MEKLYNNIILPDDFDKDMSYPNNVPYLKNPPEVINVTVGRQLFVDDFLIEQTDLEIEYHKAKKFEGNPVLYPETKLETETGRPLLAQKVVVFGTMKMRKNIKCGTKQAGFTL
ncbi:MAG: hypothetical protein IJD45_07040 [Clostridia bacterium]|nr:hypothetical protein [Clostridia bacterium]